MSEMTSVVETQQQQQQQYVGGSSNAEHHCKKCGLNFESQKSLEVHLHYHQENLLQWSSKTQQQESNNNHSKTGNHNSHVSANRDSVTVSADSNEPSSMSPSQDPTSSQQQQQSQQQPQQHPPAIHGLVPQGYDNFQTSMYGESGYFDQSYMMSHHISPQQEDAQSNGGRDNHYQRYQPYLHLQHFPQDHATSNSTSPHSPPFQCDKCGIVYEDANQLGEHMRTSHLDSPTAYPSASQYQQLGNSPQQQGQQLHSSPPLSNQPQQQSSYDYNSGQVVKLELKQEQPEEQAEILDLDSHKVHNTRYELMRLQQQQQQQQQGLQMQMHHQQVMQQQQQQQRIGSHSVSSMLSWPTTQTHDYHTGLPPMGPIDNVPIADQGQFMRGQHIPIEHGHQGSPIITSTQPMPGHQIPSGYGQQPAKASSMTNQSWKSNEPRRPKTYNCTACNKWFTSSGHLKRHYNTTLHKNAVKNGKEPDPATLPISAHHHPSRDNNTGHGTSGRGGGTPARSPSDLTSSRSPPNLMAGPLGEATRGLLHTPTTLCNNNSSSSNSSSESTAAVLVHQQQQQQQQLVQLPGIIPLTSPVQSPLAGHHQQQMGSAPHQLGIQQQQLQLHLPTGSSVQPVHHSTTSPMPTTVASHMNCPSPMDTSLTHHMNSSPDSVHPAMISPTSMGVTTMPQQPYPNASPPHVMVTISTPGLPLGCTQQAITLQPTIIGKSEQDQSDTLPGFGTIQRPECRMPNMELEPAAEPIINVGGPNAEEIVSRESFESSTPTYNTILPAFKLININTAMHENVDSIVHDQEMLNVHFSFGFTGIETNNNHVSLIQAKEDVDPNIGLPKKVRGSKTNSKQRRIITTSESNFISQNGIFKCIDCDKFFNKSCYLTQHNKSFHSGDKPYKCTQCGKRFSSEELHEKHVQMHALARKHKCEICPKIFAHKTDLKRHNCIHTGKRPFKCDICKKGFIRQDHMKKHQDTHNKRARAQQQRLQVQRYNNNRQVRLAGQRPNNQQLIDEQQPDDTYGEFKIL